jgi:hypothetical protein
MQIQYTRLFRILHAIVVAVTICLSPSLFARDDADPYYEYRDEVDRGEFSYDDSQDIPWIENETEVLAVPRPDDLTEVRMGRMPPGMALLVDKSRITVNPDDYVVRAWLWTRSDSGFEKGSFEGYRCDTREYKIYAWANPGRKPPVTKVSRPLWKSVKKGNYSYRAELLDDYFCGYRELRNANQIVDALTGEFHRDIIQKGQ